MGVGCLIVIARVGRGAIEGNSLHCPLCETGSDQGPYLKDLQPTGTLFLHVLWEDTYVHFCCNLPSAEGNRLSLDLFTFSYQAGDPGR